MVGGCLRIEMGIKWEKAQVSSQSDSFLFIPYSNFQWANNGPVPSAARVKRRHIPYPMQFFMVITVVSVVFLNGASFRPYEPLKSTNVE